MSYQMKVDFKIADWDSITRGSVKTMADNILKRGRQDVKAGGRFGPRYINALNVNVRQLAPGWAVTVRFRRFNFMKVFETGGVSIAGLKSRPKGKVKTKSTLLWIPSAPDSAHIRAKDYGQRISRLFRPGSRANPKPVLMAAKDRQVKYVGVPAIRNRKRLHIWTIAEEEARKFYQVIQTEHA